ncbi:MAG: ribonuclease P protein component [Pseudomonadota bacterium]|nr:ribonuclease P protein component [Pseudomonadota bacterium]
MTNLSVLRKRAEFLAVAGQGRKWVTPGLILQEGRALPPDQIQAQTQTQDQTRPIRYGLTASGKIGNAVVRNRARRRLRVLAENLLPKHATAGCDYVLIARASTPTRDFAALEHDLVTAIKKLGSAHGTKA